MDLGALLFLSSGLLLGWSLGANDAANVFGTAVGTRMVRFGTAAAVCSVFVVLGAVVSGAGAAHTLGTLGSVNALPGAFMAALAAAVTVYLMTKWGIAVSTTQAIVGAIVGWNLFSGSLTDAGTLSKMVATWVVCPVLAALVSVALFRVVEPALRAIRLHLLRQDAYVRAALIAAGAFGAYSLGANNIANVVGVFTDVSPFTDFSVDGWFTFTSIQQLFLLGALAIAVGVFTYSKRVMLTIGANLLPLSPVAACVVVVAHSLVLFVFASEGLEALLAGAGLPTIPLVPVSSSQAVVGAVVGLGLMRGGADIDWRLLGSIGLGWVTTPVIAALVCYVSLFFLQNVFDQRVYEPVHYRVSQRVVDELLGDRAPDEAIAAVEGREFASARAYVAALEKLAPLDPAARARALELGERGPFEIDRAGLARLDRRWFTPEQLAALRALEGRTFEYKWELAEALAAASPQWRPRGPGVLERRYNRSLERKLAEVYRRFRRPAAVP